MFVMTKAEAKADAQKILVDNNRRFADALGKKSIVVVKYINLV